MADALCFLTETLVALQNSRSINIQFKIDRIILGRRLQPKCSIVVQLPVINPGDLSGILETCFPERTAAYPPITMETASIHSGHGKMSKFQIIHHEAGFHRFAIER